MVMVNVHTSDLQNKNDLELWGFTLNSSSTSGVLLVSRTSEALGGWCKGWVGSAGGRGGFGVRVLLTTFMIPPPFSFFNGPPTEIKRRHKTKNKKGCRFIF